MIFAARLLKYNATSIHCSNKKKREKKVSLKHPDALQAKLAFTESILITYWSIRIIHKKFANLSINLIVVHGNRWFIGKFLKRNKNHFSIIIFMIVSCTYYFFKSLNFKQCRNAWLKTWFLAWTVLRGWQRGDRDPVSRTKF